MKDAASVISDPRALLIMAEDWLLRASRCWFNSPIWYVCDSAFPWGYSNISDHTSYGGSICQRTQSAFRVLGVCVRPSVKPWATGTNSLTIKSGILSNTAGIYCMHKLTILQWSDLDLLPYTKKNQPHCKRAQDVEESSGWLFDQVHVSRESRDH